MSAANNVTLFIFHPALSEWRHLLLFFVTNLLISILMLFKQGHICPYQLFFCWVEQNWINFQWHIKNRSNLGKVLFKELLTGQITTQFRITLILKDFISIFFTRESTGEYEIMRQPRAFHRLDLCSFVIHTVRASIEDPSLIEDPLQ